MSSPSGTASPSFSEGSPAAMVLWRLRYKPALRDVPEMFALRGLVFSYEAVREWEAKGVGA
ncbi:MAG: hypothetical protein JO326_01120 [Acetobacteraceae bacterium]|nr:hypothetical protein [Acetobacteraceae bacterium]